MSKKSIANIKHVLIFVDSNRRAILSSARILAKYPNVELVFAIEQSFPKRMIKLLLKNYSNQFLSYKNEAILDFIKMVKQQCNQLYILPSGEALIRLLLNNRLYLLENNVNFCLDSLKNYELISNKESFKNLCKKHELIIPVEYQQLPKDRDRKFVIKPKAFYEKESALKAPLIIEGFNDTNQNKINNLDFSCHFIQEFINGPSIYYNAYYKSGIKINHFSQINLIQQPNGKSVIKAVPYNSLPQDVIFKVDELFENLKWNGPIMFELKYDYTSKNYYCIECNPRLWGPIQLCIDNGVDFISPIIDESSMLHATEKKFGYLWFNGFIKSYILRRRYKQKAQKYNNLESAKYSFKDVYFRVDTIKYFFMELFLLLRDVLRVEKVNKI